MDSPMESVFMSILCSVSFWALKPLPVLGMGAACQFRTTELVPIDNEGSSGSLYR
ncbi:MAG: hypothetical protein ACLTSZ_03635 [Lachnospiraceae bacterium]